MIVTEAPLYACSLATYGLPALALVGFSWPACLPLACVFKWAMLAIDADTAGDTAAGKLWLALRATGARAERLRPTGRKDWNEVLQRYGAEGLRESLSATVGR